MELGAENIIVAAHKLDRPFGGRHEICPYARYQPNGFARCPIITASLFALFITVEMKYGMFNNASACTERACAIAR